LSLEELFNHSMNVSVFGSMGHNLGDEAIAIASVDYLSKRLPDVTFSVSSLVPETLAKKYDYDVFVGGRRNLRETTRRIYNSQAVLIGGGTLVQDGLSRHPFQGPLLHSLLISEIASVRNVPVITLCLGVDQLKYNVSRYFARRLINKVNLLTLRDEASLLQIKALTGRELGSAYADPAFLLEETEPTSDVLARLAEPYICVSVLSENLETAHYFQPLLETLRHSLERGFNIIFVPMDDRPSEDVCLMQSLASELPKERTWILPTTLRASDMAYVLRRATLLIGMRLHAMILAATRPVPIVGLTRSLKTTTFLKRYSAAPALAVDKPIKPRELIETLEQSLHHKCTPEFLQSRRAFAEEDKGRARAGLEAIATFLETLS
jgi:polysaccharide pyruvyl transferase WcaK-like protein